MASRNLKNGFYMHFLVIEGDSNIVVVNIAAFDISLLLARTSIFVSQKLLPAQLWFHVVNLLPLLVAGLIKKIIVMIFSAMRL